MLYEVITRQNDDYLLYSQDGYTPGNTYSIEILDTMTVSFVKAGEEDVSGLGITNVITSYSIHYTKLYELIILNVCIGSFAVSLGDIWRAIIRQGGESTNDRIIWLIRLPRLIAGVILGGGLALSGFLLQTFFNNPIAGPYVLGISSGAKLTVAIVMISVFGAYQAASSAVLILAAFVGALISMGFVLRITSYNVCYTKLLRGPRPTPVRRQAAFQCVRRHGRNACWLR